MTLATARTQMQIALGNRTDVNDLIDDQYNFAIQEVATMYEFPELKATETIAMADGDFDYSLAADFYAPIGVFDETNDRELNILNKWDFEQTDETDTGPIPHNCAFYANVLYIWSKVPDGTTTSIRVDYWKRISELTQDGDVHGLPYEWERGIRLKQAAFVFDLLGMEEKSGAKTQEFDRWLSRIKSPKSQEQLNSRDARMVPVRGWQR